MLLMLKPGGLALTFGGTQKLGKFGFLWRFEMRYMVRGKKQTGKIQEGFVHSTYVEAFAESQDFLKAINMR